MANVHMRKHQQIWQYFQQHRMVSIFAGHISVVMVLVVLFLGSTMGMHLLGAFAKVSCSHGDHTYTVVSGDTLGRIANHYNTTWQRLASYNHISNPNRIYVDQTICIPGHSNGGPAPTKGTGNYFPYGQCTWYANQRYHTLHGVYVPWTNNADAWAWTQRAHDFHWRVSSKPSVGAILDLQPWVEGAYGLGHVAIVEKVLPNGHVIASNMNWGRYYWDVTDVEFSPGPGVSFISY